ncbi:MAG TPA: hypothetical protein VIZ58_09715 [Thermoanaerobaculia bacterium]
MRRGLLFLLVAAIALATPLYFGRMDVGGGRWPVKTFRDRDRERVRMQPVDASVAELSRIPRPPDDFFHGVRRIPPVELTVYRVRARLRAVIDGVDGDVHLLLADPREPAQTMIAEIPHPMFSVGSGLGDVFAEERREVRRHRRDRGAFVEVTGIGFFDPYNHDRPGGKPTNGLELHPVIGLKFVPDGKEGGAR